MKYPHNNMITWNRLAWDLAQMLTTCPLYPSLLCGPYLTESLLCTVNIIKLIIRWAMYLIREDNNFIFFYLLQSKEILYQSRLVQTSPRYPPKLIHCQGYFNKDGELSSSKTRHANCMHTNTYDLPMTNSNESCLVIELCWARGHIKHWVRD